MDLSPQFSMIYARDWIGTVDTDLCTAVNTARPWTRPGNTCGVHGFTGLWQWLWTSSR